MEVIYPSRADSECIFNLITQVKSGADAKRLAPEIEVIRQNLIACGAECCVLACTELGIITDCGGNTLDAAEILARAIVRCVKEDISP